MSEYIACDVCDDKYKKGEEPVFAKVVLPAAWLGEDDEDLVLDICSPGCIAHMGRALGAEEDPDQTAPPAVVRDDEVVDQPMELPRVRIRSQQ